MTRQCLYSVVRQSERKKAISGCYETKAVWEMEVVSISYKAK